MTIKLLAIDNDIQQLELIQDSLEQPGLEILTTQDPVNGMEIVRREHPRIVLLDLMMPQMSGLDVLEQILAFDPGIEVVMCTGHYSSESAVQAIQKGASDYLNKPLDLTTLRARISTLIKEAQSRAESLRLDRELLHTYLFEGMVGRSPLLLDAFSKIRRIAPHYRSVLVWGATGTGKELIARALHQRSPVASGTFVACNCAALVETLFESELFGYVRGAFTGATQDKVGLFEFANGGTVFLDEIGEMPLAAQAKLLRVVQNQEVQRLGSPVTRSIDVRIIAATNRDLRAMVAEKKFREDLYYRLSMVEVTVPRLQDRKEDLPLLQRHFLEKFSAQFNKPIAGLTRRAQAILNRYSWPGNVRELENVIGNACMMAEGTVLDVKDLPERLVQTQPAEEENSDCGDLISFEELQRRHLLRVLERVNNDKTRAAEILGVSRATIYNMLAVIQAKAPAS